MKFSKFFTTTLLIVIITIIITYIWFLFTVSLTPEVLCDCVRRELPAACENYEKYLLVSKAACGCGCMPLKVVLLQ